MTESVRVLVSLAGVALYAGPGICLTDLVPTLRRRPFAERLGWAWLLGVAFIAESCFAASHFFHAPLRRHVILAIALAPVLAGIAVGTLRFRKRPSMHPDCRAECGPRRPLRLLMIAVCVLATFALFSEALTNPMRDWDGRMTWATQARYIRAQGSVSPRALTEEWWFVSHPQYPPLLPLMQVGAMEVFDEPHDERVPRVLYAAFLPAYLLVLFGAASRWAGRSAAAMATLVAVLAPFLVFDSHGGPAGSYSDFPMACFLGSGLLLILSARGGAWAGVAGGLLLGGAVLAKNEGLPLALAILFAGFLFAFGRLLRMARRNHYGRLVAPVIFATLLTVSAFALLAHWRRGIPNRFDERYELLVKRPPSVAVMRAHLASALPVMLDKTMLRSEWGYLWVVVPLVLLAGRRGLRHPATFPLLTATVAPAALGVAAYAFHWDPAGLANVTWSRFLLDGSLPVFVLLALAIRAMPAWTAARVSSISRRAGPPATE